MNKKIRSPGLLNYPVTVVESYVSEGLFVKPAQILFVVIDQDQSKFTIKSPFDGQVKSVFSAYGMVLTAPSILCEISVIAQSKNKAITIEASEENQKPTVVDWISLLICILPAAFISYWLVAVFLNGNLGNIYFDDFDIGTELISWKWYHFLFFVLPFVISWVIFFAFISELFEKLFSKKRHLRIEKKQSKTLAKKNARVKGAKSDLRTTKISSRPARQESKERTYVEWPIYFVTVVSLYVLIHATFVSSLGSWHVIVAVLAITFCALPLLLRYVGKMRKIAAQKAKPTVGNWLLNFGLLIIFVSPSFLLVVGGEGWWTLQDMLPYRSEILTNMFSHLADFQPRPTVSAAQQLAFEEYLNGK